MKSSGTQMLSSAPLIRSMALIALLLPMCLWAEAADPAIGTWELNLAKSHFEPGPPPKSQVRTYEVPTQVTQLRSRGLDAEGRPTTSNVSRAARRRGREDDDQVGRR